MIDTYTTLRAEFNQLWEVFVMQILLLNYSRSVLREDLRSSLWLVLNRNYLDADLFIHTLRENDKYEHKWI